MRVNSTNPPLKSTFFHGHVGYFCQQGDPTMKQRKGQGLLSWKWNHCVISCCATDLFLCNSTELKQTALKLEKRLLLKICSEVDDSSPKSGLRKAGLLLWAPGLWVTHTWAGPLSVSIIWLSSSAFANRTFSCFGCTVLFRIHVCIFGLLPQSP